MFFENGCFLIIHILSYDLWFYMTHILLHTPYFYKNVHCLHHEPNYKSLTYLDTNKGHIVETILQGSGIFIPFFFVTIHWNAFLFASLLIGLRGAMRHDHRCTWIIGNHHLLHHKYTYGNYGEYWLDSILGTRCKSKTEYIYGLIYT
jgi:lathosterol oxidase